MRWVEEWGEERRIASSSKSPVEVFARSTLEKRFKTKEERFEEIVLDQASDTIFSAIH